MENQIKKKILVTGAKGFVGKNLIERLRTLAYVNIFEFDLDTPEEKLLEYAKECEFVFHLAGVNRPKDNAEFMAGNFGFTSTLLSALKKFNNKAPVLITSSIQADLDNLYGQSKKAGEDLMFAYSKETSAPVFVFRLANVFGKWSRPNYNSAVATFCNNIASGLPITVNDKEAIVRLIYIDDLVDTFIKTLSNDVQKNGDFCEAGPVYSVKLGKIVDLLYSFKESRKTLVVPNMGDAFELKLYSTYLSFIPKEDFSYPLKMNLDERGSFTEFVRTPDRGQFSVNISKPGVVKGNHWHNTKNEKFLVVSGKGIIRFRKVGESEVIEYKVSGEKLEVLDIPTGYTHNIENIGDTDMITLMWANEAFNPLAPDTYFLKV